MTVKMYPEMKIKDEIISLDEKLIARFQERAKLHDEILQSYKEEVKFYQEVVDACLFKLENPDMPNIKDWTKKVRIAMETLKKIS